MENKYNFVHTEWTDFCHINNNNIRRESKNDEFGNYYFKDNILIINWEKWKGDDIFINYNGTYYQEILYNKYINNPHLVEVKIFLPSEKEFITYFININDNIIFKKDDIKNIYYIKIFNILLFIKWSESNYENFIKINNEYYSEKYINNLIDNNNIIFKKEKYIKIENKYYLNSNVNENIQENNNIHGDEHVHENISQNMIIQIKDNSLNFNNNNHSFNIIDLDINVNKIYENILKLNDNNLLNKNYLNINNIQKYTKDEQSIIIFDDIINININFDIPLKTKKRSLSLVEWGYPPFGGGENWLLNFNKILFNNNYDNYLICFSDPFKNEYFDGFNLIDLNYIKIIQMEKNLLSIIKIIKIINPDIINHQGVNRDFFMKISNVLEIPFLTGFCFWQNIVKFNQDNLNINMLNNNNLEKTEEFNEILENSYTYASSDFVNDIIDKIYNIKLDVIETISLKDDFYVDFSDISERKYVTLINCHYNKGGFLIDFLCNNLNFNIPLQLVYTENDPNITSGYVTNLINKRNLHNNINVLYLEKIDIKIIYKNTRILLIPSLCDETFCRVAYEGMLNKIPILSTKNGNLKYLLKDYAIFIEDLNKIEWLCNIHNIYNNINEYIKPNIINAFSEEYIESKIIKKLNGINSSKYKLNDKNIGLIIPWADQGLGIQGRDYYVTLKNIGYNPHVLSFKPYHATHDNIYLQSDKNEWNYDNIFYSQNYREDLTYDEIFNFIYKNKIKTIIIIEATFVHIFKIALFLKILNIKIFLVVNIECIRLVEINYHDVFNKILTNNSESYNIINTIFQSKSIHLGFHLNYPYYKKINKEVRNIKNIKFCCMGGLNSLSRKNINLVIIVFYKIFQENKYLNWELNVYIQGVEIPDIISKYKCKNIHYYVKNFSYKEIIDKYFDNDIFIHLGSHEGLGLGFYESLYIGLPVLTIDWIPNNEIIKNYINGWLIECSFSNVNDNDNSLINRGILSELSLTNKVIEILFNKDKTVEIIKNTIYNKDIIYNENRIRFENNLLDLFNN